MEPILTRCGYRCDLCLAYRPNVEAHPENQQKLSDGWFKYFGFRVKPEHILCDGCLFEGEISTQMDAACPVRPCVKARGLENCAACGEYICEKLKERVVRYEDFNAKFGSEIPADDRADFIAPYENFERLEALRKKA